MMSIGQAACTVGRYCGGPCRESLPRPACGERSRAKRAGEGDYLRSDPIETPPCMVGRPNQRKLKGASGPVATDPDADGRDRGSPSVTGTVGEHGPSVL